jgi:hypothetical protein
MVSESRGSSLKDAADKGQRKGRTDRILIDLEPIQGHGIHVRWVCASLETLCIAAFASNNRERGGLNVNTSDWLTHFNGRPFAHMKKVWNLVKTTLDENPEMTLAPARRFEPFFERDLKPVLERNGIHESGPGVERLIRSISPLADTNRYPHFPPLRVGAFTTRRPYLRNSGRETIVRREYKVKQRLNAVIDRVLNRKSNQRNLVMRLIL